MIYARYSSDKQTEQSIEGQLHVCKEYALQHDIVIVDTYIDRAMTGKNDRREDFQRMLRDSQKKLWDYVLVYKLDRFSRNKYETAIHKKTLRDNGIRLLSAMENIPETPEGIILESLLEGMAEYYSAELAQKVSRGMQETRRKGNFCGGPVLYGYRVENKKMLINNDTAPIVRWVFERYATGLSALEIKNELNNRGVTYKGKPFVFNTLYRMLRNERYTGVYHAHGEVFDKTYPTIIEPKLFERVQRIIAGSTSGRAPTTTDYILRGKLICGYCGRPINGESGTSQCGKPCYYYKCSSRKRRQPCQKETVRKDQIENLVMSVIEQMFADRQLQIGYAEKILASYQTECQDMTLLNHLTKELDKVDTAIENMLQALEAGIITDSTNQRLKDLEIRRTDIRAKIEKEKHQKDCRLTEQSILSFFATVLKLSGRQLIQLLIKKIVLYNDRTEILFEHTKTGDAENEMRNITVYESDFPFTRKESNAEQSIQVEAKF